MSPVVPPSREEKGLTIRAGIFRMYTNQALGVSREPSASCLIPAWTTAEASPCSPSFYRAPPIWAACLPQPEQSFQTINQITLLPTPLPPHLPIRSRREAKPSLGPQCSMQGWGLGENRFSAVSPHPPSLSISAVSFLTLFSF